MEYTDGPGPAGRTDGSSAAERTDGSGPAGRIDGSGPAELGPTASKISRQVVQLHAQLFGRGPTRAKTHLTEEYALCILEDVFTAAERTLIRAGNFAQVNATRAAFQDAVEKDFISIAEAATGRKVRALLSQVNLETETAIELFLFEGPDEAVLEQDGADGAERG
jgi:uncharacterized protein YbcI